MNALSVSEDGNLFEKEKQVDFVDDRDIEDGKVINNAANTEGTVMTLNFDTDSKEEN